MNKELLIKLIHKKLDEEVVVSYEHGEQEFYFYINNMNFRLKSTESNVSLVISEEVRTHEIKDQVELNLTLEEALPLVDKCIKVFVNKHNTGSMKEVEKLGFEKFDKILSQVTEIIKTKDLKEDIEKFKTYGAFLDKYVYDEIIEGVSCRIKLGNLCSLSIKPKYHLTSFLTLPIILFEKETEVWIHHEMVIPSYKMDEYPSFKYFTINKVYREENTDIEKLNYIFNRFEDGKKLMHDLLSVELDEKKEGKRAKI